MTEIYDKGTKLALIADMGWRYTNAGAGSKVVVTDTKNDDYGFPLIYVEWDKDDPKYSGQKDMWTHPSHFKPANEIFSVMENMGDFTQQIIEREKEKGIDSKKIEQYLSCVNAAVNTLFECDGFVLISTHFTENEDSVAISTNVEGGATTLPSFLTLDAKVIEMAAMKYEQMIVKNLMSLGVQVEDEDENNNND